MTVNQAFKIMDEAAAGNYSCVFRLSEVGAMCWKHILARASNRGYLARVIEINPDLSIIISAKSN
jgi:hypothetical protein